MNPLYYVTFTTFTLIASFILFRGFNTTDIVNTISLICGFLIIFTGVYLLNLSREDPDGSHLGIKSGDERGKYHEVDGIPVDGVAGLGTRLSMQARRSSEDELERHRRSTSWSLRSPVTDHHNLMHNYDIEARNMDGLVDDSDDDDDDNHAGRKRTAFENTYGPARAMNGTPVGGTNSARTVETEHLGISGKGLE